METQTMLKMSDIAERAGVSATTVSFVLNGRHNEVRISEATRQKVLAAAETAGYRANHQARATRTGKTRMIGILGGELGTEQVGRMMSGALAEIEAHDYTLKLLPSHPGDAAPTVQQMVRRGSELRLAGVIALHLPPHTLEQLRAESESYGYPMLLLDTRAPHADCDWPQVVSDDEGGVRAAVEHLFELGHRRIAMISGAPISTLVSLRKRAFRAEMARHGMNAPEDDVRQGDFLERAPSLTAARELLNRPAKQRPTALFCAGDFMALCVLQVAAELGLRVPDDLSVIGFADLAMAAFATPPLTTVRQEFDAMGILAARRLLQECEGVSPAVSPLELTPTRLIVRGTTGPALAV